MLTAAAASPKTKLKRKILFHEDEITSCIFGEMQHLPTEEIWMIFRQLTKDAIKNDRAIGNLFHGSPDDVKFKFWPQWETKCGYVEPDLVVQFKKNNNPILNIIVEIKWGASLYPPCELIRQWNHRTADIKKTAPWVHLYLVKDTSFGMTEIVSFLSDGEQLCENRNCAHCVDKDKEGYKGPTFDYDEWRGVLGCIGWRHLIVAANQIVKGNTLWNKGISIFFSRQGIEPFVGFEWLNNYSEIGGVSEEEMIYFRKVPWFSFLNSESFDDNIVEESFPSRKYHVIERGSIMNGKTLLKAAEIIAKSETQIDALMADLDRSIMVELEKQYGRVACTEDSDAWVWFRNYALIDKGKRTASQHLAVQVVLYDEEEKEIDGWEPSLYVMYGKGPEPFNIKEEWGFKLSEPAKNFLNIKHCDRLLRWEADEAADIDEGWGFVVPLVKLSSEETLIKQIVKPTIKLLGGRSPSDIFLLKDSIAFQFTTESDHIKILPSVV